MLLVGSSVKIHWPAPIADDPDTSPGSPYP
jgi:hypothetical protein